MLKIKNALWNSNTKAFYWLVVKAAIAGALVFLVSNIKSLVNDPYLLVVLAVLFNKVADLLGISLPQNIAARKVAKMAAKNVV